MTRPQNVVALRPAPSEWVPADDRLFCTLTVGEYRALQEELQADRAPVPALTGPMLVSGAELGRLLGCSRTQVHRLRLEGAPAVRLGDVYKFEPAAVLAWLRERSAT